MTQEPTKKRADELVGRVLSDRYRVDELIASGSMGSVYRGLHLKMRKHVAIKVLHPETEDFPDLVHRFEREAVAGAHIQHPNVAAASDMGTFDDGSYFLVLEYVKGRTLRDVIAREAPFQPRRAAALARQLAAALSAAHAKGIIHRDLKPRNVMVTDGPDERIKLIDFGLARVIVEDVAPLEDDPNPMKKSLSATGVVFGTVGYMAPETAFGMKAVNERSDLYSLGVIFYEMLSGDHPFSAIDPRELFQLHRSAKPAPLSRGSLAVPKSLEALVMQLLEKDPAARPENAEKVISAIDEALGAAPPDLPSEEIVVSYPPPSGRRARTLALGGVLVVALGAAAAWGLLRRTPAAPAEPSASATTAPVASAPPSATSVAAPDASALGARSREDALLASKLVGELVSASGTADAPAILVELGEVAPGALREPNARAAAARAAETAADKAAPDADRVYYALAYKFGPDGLDVLYDLLSSPSSKASSRASSILDIQGASQHATPALRIALDLSKASCQDKALLLDRAGKEGDARTLALLQKLEPPGCKPAPGVCCYPRYAPLERAIVSIEARASEKK